jgi:predicted MFS family arabinose efflux permease
MAIASPLAGFFEVSPLRHPPFRRYYYGSVGTALGFTMLATAAAWLMATLTPSALMVALVQTASTAPTLAFGLIAGALADLVDRRRIIVWTQIVMMATGVLLGMLTLYGLANPVVLLLLILVVGAAFTFYMPASGASINEMVGRNELPRAVALGAVAFNVSRAIGPALAGAIAAWWGTAWSMFFATICFVPMFYGVRSVRRAEQSLAGVPETLLSGVMIGIRYARHSLAMRSFLIRNLAFAACASALWALLPVIARDQLGLGAGGFGLLFGMFGAGAVISALLMPGQLQKRSLTAVVTYAVLFWTVAVLLIAASRFTPLALLGAAIAGAAWVGTLASLGAGTQSAAPGWVRARAMAINLLAVQASLAIGSAIWGALANAFGTQTTLFLSAGVMVLLHFLIRNVRVDLGEEADVTTVPSPEMGIRTEPLPNDGPVLVQFEYRIDSEHVPAFLQSIHALGDTRRRNGASAWRVFRDLGEDGKFVERYIVGSWAEYIRLRSRMTIADRRIQEQVFSLQRPGIDIRVSRLIGLDPDTDPAQHVARPRQERKSADTFLRPETEHPDPERVHPPRPKRAAGPVAAAAAEKAAPTDEAAPAREAAPADEVAPAGNAAPKEEGATAELSALSADGQPFVSQPPPAPTDVPANPGVGKH